MRQRPEAIARRGVRVTVLLGCGVALTAIVLSNAAPVRGGNDAVTTRVCFKRWQYTGADGGEDRPPAQCASYIRLQSGARPKPLFVCGFGKEGGFDLSIASDDLVGIRSTGTGIVEFTEFAASPAGDLDDYSCNEWLEKNRPLTATILRLDGWEEIGDKMKEFVGILGPRESPEQPPIPQPTFKAVADIEIGAGARTVLAKSVPVNVRFVFHSFGARRNSWLVTVCGGASFKGDALGLAGPDAGDIRFDLVAVGLRWVPLPHKAVNVSIDADATDTGVTRD